MTAPPRRSVDLLDAGRPGCAVRRAGGPPPTASGWHRPTTAHPPDDGDRPAPSPPPCSCSSCCSRPGAGLRRRPRPRRRLARAAAPPPARRPPERLLPAAPRPAAPRDPAAAPRVAAGGARGRLAGRPQPRLGLGCAAPPDRRCPPDVDRRPAARRRPRPPRRPAARPTRDGGPCRSSRRPGRPRAPRTGPPILAAFADRPRADDEALPRARPRRPGRAGPRAGRRAARPPARLVPGRRGWPTRLGPARQPSSGRLRKKLEVALPDELDAAAAATASSTPAPRPRSARRRGGCTQLVAGTPLDVLGRGTCGARRRRVAAGWSTPTRCWPTGLRRGGRSPSATAAWADALLARHPDPGLLARAAARGRSMASVAARSPPSRMPARAGHPRRPSPHPWSPRAQPVAVDRLGAGKTSAPLQSLDRHPGRAASHPGTDGSRRGSPVSRTTSTPAARSAASPTPSPSARPSPRS